MPLSIQEQIAQYKDSSKITIAPLRSSRFDPSIGISKELLRQQGNFKRDTIEKRKKAKEKRNTPEALKKANI